MPHGRGDRRRSGGCLLPSRPTPAQLLHRREGAVVSDQQGHEKGQATAGDLRVSRRERAALPPRAGTGRIVCHVTRGLWEGTLGGRGRSPRRSRDWHRDRDRDRDRHRDGAAVCRINELRHRLPQGPIPRLSFASGRCRGLRRLGATSPLETQHPPCPR